MVCHVSVTWLLEKLNYFEKCVVLFISVALNHTVLISTPETDTNQAWPAPGFLKRSGETLLK